MPDRGSEYPGFDPGWHISSHAAWDKAIENICFTGVLWRLDSAVKMNTSDVGRRAQYCELIKLLAFEKFLISEFEK